ncbi:Glucose-1-phosphate adenylyltransferase [Edwardsiella tarda]|nr:Glucose-1-phosphate adenylyltransferase [Edwardsiella tarda]
MTHSVTDIALIGQLTQRTVALVLAGGRGTRLNGLTDGRAKPAVYFGSRFRIIDFTLSNCINSGLRRVGVITQYKAHSLLRHIQHGWSFLHAERNEFIDLLPARQQLEEGHWYRGTADAVYQNKSIMQQHYRPEYVVILAGDHIYKMNYAQMLLDHVKSGAQCTVGCIEVPREQAHAFGLWPSMSNSKSPVLKRNPRIPPPCLATRHAHWPRWGSIFLMPITSTKRSMRRKPIRRRASISVKISSRRQCAPASPMPTLRPLLHGIYGRR